MCVKPCYYAGEFSYPLIRRQGKILFPIKQYDCNERCSWVLCMCRYATTVNGLNVGRMTSAWDAITVFVDRHLVDYNTNQHDRGLLLKDFIYQILDVRVINSFQILEHSIDEAIIAKRECRGRTNEVWPHPRFGSKDGPRRRCPAFAFPLIIPSFHWNGVWANQNSASRQFSRAHWNGFGAIKNSASRRRRWAREPCAVSIHRSTSLLEEHRPEWEGDGNFKYSTIDFCRWTDNTLGLAGNSTSSVERIREHRHNPSASEAAPLSTMFQVIQSSLHC